MTTPALPLATRVRSCRACYLIVCPSCGMDIRFGAREGYVPRLGWLHVECITQLQRDLRITPACSGVNQTHRSKGAA